MIPKSTVAEARLPGEGGAFWKGLVLGRLAGLAEGWLALRDASGEVSLGATAPDGLAARLEVRHPRFWRRVATGGTLAAAEAYADGDWEPDDLTAVVRVLARNADALDSVEGGLASLRRPFDALAHALRRNTREGSRRNIADHYDLGNDFFALMLDPTMTYSCGLFERESSTLEEASVAKIERLCRMLRLRPGDHLLEIGSGWGALAMHAAARHGCRVTTATVSRRQYDLARERVERAGLDGRVRVLLRDYRDLEGQYDRLVSVEMLEAVGARYYRTFFAKCASLLREDGLMALQVITIADQRYEQHRRSADFIKRRVFPGSNIPSVTALLAASTAASDLRLRHLEDIGPHYARTLAAWRENLARRGEEVARITEPRFRRLWHYYLCYCEAAFAERYLGDVQMLLARPRAGG
jgi:cyclopropane-fatty-acyl-phospholipid synthase